MFELAPKSRRTAAPSPAPKPAPRLVQRKPTVSSSVDPYEREADDVADKVMRMAESMATGPAPAMLQRQCATCEEKKRTPSRPMILAQSSIECYSSVPCGR